MTCNKCPLVQSNLGHCGYVAGNGTIIWLPVCLDQRLFKPKWPYLPKCNHGLVDQNVHISCLFDSKMIHLTVFRTWKNSFVCLPDFFFCLPKTNQCWDIAMIKLFDHVNLINCVLKLFLLCWDRTMWLNKDRHVETKAW